MRSFAAGGRLTVRLACAAASLLRPMNASTSAAAAAAVTAAPAIALRCATAVFIALSQVIEPKSLYHAILVNAKLKGAMPIRRRPLRLRRGLLGANRKPISGNCRGLPGPVSAIDRGSTRLTLE